MCYAKLLAPIYLIFGKLALTPTSHFAAAADGAAVLDGAVGSTKAVG